METEYLLFYSKNCIYCTDLMNKLYKNQNLYKKFILINVNNKNIKIPPFVKSVPSILVTEGNNRDLLVGSQVFDWLKNKTEVEVDKSIGNWDPVTMSGYSDSFSYLDEGNTAMEKNYSFLGKKAIGINTPSEGSNIKTSSNQPKSKVDMAYEQLVQSRKLDAPKPITRQ